MDKECKNENISNGDKKRCFIITPIGSEDNPIRRHVDGLIDECIMPTLQSKYTVEVAHRITTPGSINNQVIEAIYNADLVIANLTGLNPNVMYELAFRHATGKPVIMIMEKGDIKIPFDITAERTIFYSNDFQGAIELKRNLQSMVEAIQELNNKDVDNPIYSALQKITAREVILQNVGNEDMEKMDAFKYILNRLDEIENKLSKSNIRQNENYDTNKSGDAVCCRVRFKDYNKNMIMDKKTQLAKNIRYEISSIDEVKLIKIVMGTDIRIYISIIKYLDDDVNEVLNEVYNAVKRAFLSSGVDNEFSLEWF